LLPAYPENFSHHAIYPTYSELWAYHLVQSVDPESATRGCPLRRTLDISERALWRNEEAPRPQPVGALFDQVLRKKHAIRAAPKFIQKSRLSAAPEKLISHLNQSLKSPQPNPNEGSDAYDLATENFYLVHFRSLPARLVRHLMKPLISEALFDLNDADSHDFGSKHGSPGPRRRRARCLPIRQRRRLKARSSTFKG